MRRLVLIAFAVVTAAVPALICRELAPAAPHWVWWATSSLMFAGLVGLVAVAMDRDRE